MHPYGAAARLNRLHSVLVTILAAGAIARLGRLGGARVRQRRLLFDGE
jgi:hypothetical protein